MSKRASVLTAAAVATAALATSAPAGAITPVERAFASGQPALVNVLTDPSVAYPRSANLA